MVNWNPFHFKGIWPGIGERRIRTKEGLLKEALLLTRFGKSWLKGLRKDQLRRVNEVIIWVILLWDKGFVREPKEFGLEALKKRFPQI